SAIRTAQNRRSVLSDAGTPHRHTQLDLRAKGHGYAQTRLVAARKGYGAADLERDLGGFGHIATPTDREPPNNRRVFQTLPASTAATPTTALTTTNHPRTTHEPPNRREGLPPPSSRDTQSALPPVKALRRLCCMGSGCPGGSVARCLVLAVFLFRCRHS